MLRILVIEFRTGRCFDVGTCDDGHGMVKARPVLRVSGTSLDAIWRFGCSYACMGTVARMIESYESVDAR